MLLIKWMPLADWPTMAAFKVIKLEVRLKIYYEILLHDSLGGGILIQHLILSCPATGYISISQGFQRD